VTSPVVHSEGADERVGRGVDSVDIKSGTLLGRVSRKVEGER
jgi:hypothetical protein